MKIRTEIDFSMNENKQNKVSDSIGNFYMVFVEGGNSPIFKHTTFESAEKEAKRFIEHSNELELIN